MKIFKAGYSWFYKEEEVQSYIGYYKDREDAERAIKDNKNIDKRCKGHVLDEFEYFINEIEVL